MLCTKYIYNFILLYKCIIHTYMFFGQKIKYLIANESDSDPGSTALSSLMVASQLIIITHTTDFMKRFLQCTLMQWRLSIYS